MKINKWFDPNNVEHIKAFKEFDKTGSWPKEFLPKDVKLDQFWIIDVLDKMAVAWMNYKLKGVK
jgi:hypothetical protein